MQILDLFYQDGALVCACGTLNQVRIRGIFLSDFHNIDVLRLSRSYRNELASDGFCESFELMSLERSHGKNLDPLLSHAQKHREQSVSFTGSGRSKDHHIGVLILGCIKIIDENRRTIAGICAQEYAAFVTKFVSCEGITGAKAGCHNVVF